jgi:DNA-3-methyladenine glycosylase
MFGPPGRAYVYRIYGLHHCFNVVAGPIGSGEAVLLRGLELRLAAGRQIGAEVAPGPGRLAALFGLDLAHDGLPLLDGGGPLALWRDPALPLSRAGIAQGRRIGLGAGRGQELALRLAQVGSPAVSRPRPFERRVLGAAEAPAESCGGQPQRG